MPGAYHFVPHSWPMLGAAAASFIVAAYAWRRRARHAAVPLAVLAAITFLWGLAAALEVAGVQIADVVFWHKFERLCQLLAATGTLCFALEYAHLDGWCTRWTLPALAAIPGAFAILIITNDRYALIWTGFSFDGDDVRPVFGVAKWIFIDYEMLLGVLAAAVFVWLFARSPLHRRSSAACLIGLVAARVTYVLETVVPVNPLGAVDWTVVVSSSSLVIYGLMLLRFSALELIPMAHGNVIQQMHEGVLVLDADQRVLQANPAAATMLGLPAESAQGLNARTLPAFQVVEAWLGESGQSSREIQVGSDGDARWYSVSRSPMNAGDRPQGHLLLLKDVTDEKRARAEAIQQQCAVAALRERSMLARELHDNLGQVLGFVKMQAQTARDLLARDERSRADDCLARVAAAAQDAHVDIRRYIESTAGTASADGGLRTSLAQYLQRFREASGLAVTLNGAEALDALALEPPVEAHLLRIVQEALNNVWKHAQAKQVAVSLANRDGFVEAVVRDDGVGFDPVALGTANGHGFGLRFMRERASEAGGGIGICSKPGEGTEMVIRVLRRSAAS